MSQDPAVRTWQDATEAAMAMSTSALGRSLQTQLDQLRTEYNAVLLERDALADELSDERGRIVDLLYTLDAFQIESGADRNASHATGIEAVRQLHARVAELEQEKAAARQLAAEYRAGGM